MAVLAAYHAAPRREMHRFKHVLHRIDSRVGDSTTVPRLSLSSEGYLYPRAGLADRQQASSETEQRSLLVKPRDLVINPMWLTGGSIAVSDLSGAVSPDYRVFEPDPAWVMPRFLHHLLRSRPYRHQYGLFVRANTTFDRRIQQEDLDGLPLWLPSVEYQRRIADFLDERVARIDQIIAARRQQAAAVEKLLKQIPDRLLSNRPEPWIRLGLMTRRIEQGWSPQCENVPADDGEWGVLKVSAVQPGWFDASQNKRLPDAEQPRSEYEIRPGDLLVSRANSPERVGFFTVVPQDVRRRLILCDKIMRIDLDDSFEPAFVSLVGQSRAVRDTFTIAGTGTSDSMVNIRGDDVRNLRLPAMSKAAQLEAVATWSEESTRLRDHIQSIASATALMQEYKQALITAAVTGELDVTTGGSGIPG